MSGVEISKILNLLAETEIREESSSAKKLDNLRKLWNRNNEKLQERLAKVDKGNYSNFQMKVSPSISQCQFLFA